MGSAALPVACGSLYLVAELLPLLDAAVEIPQLGVVRSLNVHVSAAIATYAYTCQHAPHA